MIYSKLDTVDYIYYGSYWFDSDIVILTEEVDYTLNVILRQQNFIILCGKSGCGCGYYIDVIKNKEDFLNILRKGIGGVSSYGEIQFTKPLDSGFGFYLRDLCCQLVCREVLRIRKDRKEAVHNVQLSQEKKTPRSVFNDKFKIKEQKPNCITSSENVISDYNQFYDRNNSKCEFGIQIHKDRSVSNIDFNLINNKGRMYVNYHGAESESVLLMAEQKYDDIEFRFFGIPNFEDDEFVLLDIDDYDDLNTPNIISSWFLEEHDVFILKKDLNLNLDEFGGIGIFGYEEDIVVVSRSPIDVNLNLSFHNIELVFHDKIIIENDCVQNTLPFYKCRNVIIISDDVNLQNDINLMNKMRGIPVVVLVCRFPLTNNIIAANNLMYLGISDFIDSTIYSFYLLNKFRTHYDYTDEFRSRLVRNYIRYGDMFEDFTPITKIFALSISNVRNSDRWYDYIKVLADKNIAFIATFPSSEVYSFCLGYHVTQIKEFGWEDFCINNAQIIGLNNVQWFSLKEVEVYLYPKNYLPKIDVLYDLTQYKALQWGMLTNIFTYSFQNIFNSPTLLIKSISTTLQKKYRLGAKDLHFMRFRALKSKLNDNDLVFVGSDDKHWSLSYSKKDKKYYDISGHLVNLILLSQYKITDFGRYLAQINLNSNDDKITDWLCYSKEIQLMCQHSFELYPEERFKGEKNRNTLWHTFQEFIDAFSAAGYIINELNLYNLLPIRFVRDYFVRNLRIPRGKLSVTVSHDKSNDEDKI